MTGKHEKAKEPGKQKSRARRFVGHAVHVCIFLVLVVAVFVYGNMAVGFPGKAKNEGVWETFYGEQEDSIDVMYYGTSASSRFFNNVYAYHETGLVSYQFGIEQTPSFLIDDLIEYSRKTQHAKLYVIELRPFLKDAGEFQEEDIRRDVDSMRFTDTGRIALYQEGLAYMRKYLKKGDYDDSLKDYLFPLIAYHDRLADGEVTTDELLLKRTVNPYKGFCLGGVNVTQVPQKAPAYKTESGELSDYQQETLQKLLDYVGTLDAQVLFVASPHKTTTEESLLTNALCEYVEDAGYDCVNFNTDEMIDELGLDFSTDFYNRNHTNYLGSEKYTKWLANYIMEHYGLSDRRGDSTYQSWEDGYEQYENYVAKGIRVHSDKQVEG